MLAALGDRGYSTISEAALGVLREQQKRNSELLPWKNRIAFTEEVLARNIRSYLAARTLPTPVFFDRGIPECLAWLELFGAQLTSRHLDATAEYRYAPIVFAAEPWPEIYVQNGERQATFERAARSYEPTVLAYVKAGYEICVLPKSSLHERVEFILERIKADA